ncbi:MAG TPA: XrtA-associated tyrosine autokinase [Rubrivivax sp.]|nr:XrtA-associated tyrosine autokinase [Rubrivivax sp.]
MSSLIEQAAQRLEQLRRAGIAVPEPTAPAMQPAAAAAMPAPDVVAAEPAQVREEPVVSSRRVELDLAMLEATGIVTPNAPRSHIADEFRVVKRPLISNAMGRGAAALTHGNLIMVTSAMSGEGKSFTSVNLAMSIAAEMDHTVMLVDADVARPSVLRMLGLPAAPGLLDLLEGKAEMSGVLMKTNIDKLTILPSGTPHARATELLASDAMRLLLDDISKRYPDRIVIFDSPPLILTTEARVLATQMGQVVMVVQADKTLQADVQQALATIEACPVKMMLLNKVRVEGKGSYGYGYGYGYGHGYGRKKQAA